jgi:cyclopropane-fatty-acyl-phospholipid synthase
MPSDHLLHHFQQDLRLEDHWRVSGLHYQRTADAWLANLDRNREQALGVLAGVYGRPHAQTWLNRWRVFFLACSELWGLDRGEQWIVSHYRFSQL